VRPNHVEAASGGEFLGAAPATRHTACGFGRKRDFSSMSSVAAISKIQRFRDLGLQPRHVFVADVAAVFAQMRGDAVGAGRDRPASAARPDSGREPPRALRRVAT